MRKRLIWFLAAVTVTVSAQVPADAPRFTDDEIAIYRDFLLHYPEQLGNMIGMQDTTVAFVASMTFGDESDPPNGGVASERVDICVPSNCSSRRNSKLGRCPACEV
jgi:hypothetical protein